MTGSWPGAGGDAFAPGRHQPVIDREVLLERARSEDVVAEVNEVDVHVAAAGKGIRMALGKAVGAAVLREDVHAVDLEFERGRRGPHQTAHAAVADRQAFLAASHGFVVSNIRSRDYTLVIHREQAAGRIGRGPLQ